jgi:hypothetical protein
MATIGVNWNSWMCCPAKKQNQTSKPWYHHRYTICGACQLCCTPVKGGWREPGPKPATPSYSPVLCYTSIHDILFGLFLLMNTGSLVLLTPEVRAAAGAIASLDSVAGRRQIEETDGCRKRQPVAQWGNHLPKEEGESDRFQNVSESCMF